MIPIVIIMTISLTELSQQTAKNAIDPVCLPQLAQYHSRRFRTTWGHQRAPRHSISNTRAAYGGVLCAVTPLRRCTACGIHHRVYRGLVCKWRNAQLILSPHTPPQFHFTLPSSSRKKGGGGRWDHRQGGGEWKGLGGFEDASSLTHQV